MKLRFWLVALLALAPLALRAQTATVAEATTAVDPRPALTAAPEAEAEEASTAPATEPERGFRWFGRARTPEEQARLEEEKRKRREQVDLMERQQSERLTELELKEATLTRRREQRPIFRLREQMNAIDRDAAVAQESMNKELTKQSELREQRTRDRRRLTEWKASNKASDESVTELSAQIDNDGEGIVLHSLEAGRWDALAVLATEATRLNEAIEALPPSPRPTVRLILEKRRIRLDEEQRLVKALAAEQSLNDMRNELLPARELLQNRVTELDERIRILEDKYDLTRDRAVRDTIALEKVRRRMTDERATLLTGQIAAVDGTIETAKRLQALYRAALAVFDDDLDTLTRRYRHSVMVPLALIGILAAIFLVISRLILPRFYQRDRLFIARRLGRYITLLIIFGVVVSFFFEDLRPFATTLGIAGAALVIALQDLCSAFAGWFVIIASRKVRVGDRIEVDGHRGDVLDIQLLRTTLVEVRNWLNEDEPTGRVIVLPNSYIFKNTLINFTHVHPYIWDRLDITVTNETPWREAEALLRRVLEEETREEFEGARRGGGEMQNLYGIADSVYEPRLYSVIADSGVLFRLLFVSHYRRISATRDRLNVRILTEFEKDPRMQLAYPTQRQVH